MTVPSPLDDPDILSILLKIDAMRGVKVGNPLLIHRLQVTGFVVIVLGDKTYLFGPKTLKQSLQE